MAEGITSPPQYTIRQTYARDPTPHRYYSYSLEREYVVMTKNENHVLTKSTIFKEASFTTII
jgi:hypothetical protein